MERFVEDAPITNKRKTGDGYLVVDVRCARTGTQEYRGFELGKPTMDRIVVFRPESVVFDRATMASYAGKPVTDDHPPEPVTADNWRNYSRGSVGAEVVRDGDFIRVPMMVMDQALIGKIEAGKREISMGYMMALDWTPGTTPDGKPYDALMTGMRSNHAAIVDRGRAGSECRVGDSDAGPWGAAPITTTDKGTPPVATKMMTLDAAFGGLPIEVTDAAERVINKLTTDLAASASKITTHDAALAAKDAAHTTALAAKDAEIARLTGLIPTADDVSRMIADRVALETAVKTIDPRFTIDAALDSNALRKAVVVAQFGEAAVKDATPDAVNGMFQALTIRTTAANDGIRQDLNNGKPIHTADHGQSAYEERIRAGRNYKAK